MSVTIINDSNELVAVNKLQVHPNNPRQGDVGAVCASIEAHGFYGALVVQRSTSFVLAGNHRLLAAKQLKMKKVPVVWVDVDEEQAKRILLADNRTSDLGTYDETVLADLLKDLAATEVGLDGLGYDGDDLDDLIMRGSDAGITAEYSSKVESPIYEPTGKQPKVADLADVSGCMTLIEEVSNADVPDDIRSFLTLAAHRHTKFDYEAIANYYAHAPANIQRLMEASALVIIDFEQAIERGFVSLHTSISDTFGEDYPDA